MNKLLSMEGKILYLPLCKVRQGPMNRRRNALRLQELAASIRDVGILQPLTVRKEGDLFIVVSGNRRLMAAKMAGLGEVPCILLDVDPADVELVSLIENLQREDLHYFEEARLMQQYLIHSGLTQAKAARKLGRSQAAVANKLRLLNHSPRVRQALEESGLTERHARALLRVHGEEERLMVLRELVERQYTAVRSERFIDVYLKNRAASTDVRLLDRDIRLLLRRIAEDTRIMNASGIRAECEKQEEDGAITLTLRIDTRA